MLALKIYRRNFFDFVEKCFYKGTNEKTLLKTRIQNSEYMFLFGSWLIQKKYKNFKLGCYDNVTIKTNIKMELAINVAKC